MSGRSIGCVRLLGRSSNNLTSLLTLQRRRYSPVCLCLLTAWLLARLRPEVSQVDQVEHVLKALCLALYCNIRLQLAFSDTGIAPGRGAVKRADE